MGRAAPRAAWVRAHSRARAHCSYIVTEYGIAELEGKSLRERAAALIAIAHPDHRERLRAEASGRMHA